MMMHDEYDLLLYMMMHDARMKSYYISAGEMNMDWIEVKATCMWCMSKVVPIQT